MESEEIFSDGVVAHEVRNRQAREIASVEAKIRGLMRFMPAIKNTHGGPLNEPPAWV